AGLLALMYLVLSWRVIQFRQRGISLGDGNDPKMLRLIRGHANFAEYVPLILLMMGFLELGHTSRYLLHVLGIALVGARLLHGYALSFSDRSPFGRTWGAGLTFVVPGASGVLCLLQGIRGLALF
ncbi:MAG: MAPEG family protein, partial [Betaproteobacteria bacterium]